MAVVEGLEAIGVAAEIWFVIPCREGYFKMAMAIKVKGTEEYLMPGLINWLYENPAWFRGVGLAAVSKQFEDNGMNAPWGLGRPRQIECGFEDADIIIPAVYNEAAAKEELKKILVKFGE